MLSNSKSRIHAPTLCNLSSISPVAQEMTESTSDKCLPEMANHQGPVTGTTPYVTVQLSSTPLTFDKSTTPLMEVDHDEQLELMETEQSMGASTAAHEAGWTPPISSPLPPSTTGPSITTSANSTTPLGLCYLETGRYDDSISVTPGYHHYACAFLAIVSNLQRSSQCDPNGPVH